MKDYNVAQFFRPLIERGSDNRIVCCYDSMSASNGTLIRSTVARAIAETWEIPNLADGTSGWVGVADGGNAFTSKLMTAGDYSNHGWTKLNGRSPGGTSSDTSPLIVNGPASGGETGIACQHYADWNIAGGASRTAYGGDGSVNGVIFNAVAGKSYTSASQTHIEPMEFTGAGNPFDTRQCHARFLFTKNVAGPTDTRICGIRQQHASHQTSLLNTAILNKTTFSMNVGSGIEFGYVDANCGAGSGNPGYLIINPDVTAGTGATTLRIYNTGRRIFRSTAGGVPIAGTSLAEFAVGSQSDIHHSSLMGVSGLLAGEPANRQGPDPYVDPLNAQAYLSALAGRTGTANTYPNMFVIYTGHNKSTAEPTELTSGESATARAATLGLMQQHDANAVALGSELPRYLIVHCEKFFTGYSLTQINNYRRTMQRCAVDFGPRASYMDLHDRTDDGTALTTAMWYSVGAAGPSMAGAASKTINAITAAASAQVTTSAAHGYTTGNTVNIFGSNSTPSVDGTHVITVTSTTTFTIPVTTSGTGSAGTVYTGPLLDTGIDNVHNNFAGNRYIWRMVWEIGMKALGYDHGVVLLNKPRQQVIQALRNR